MATKKKVDGKTKAKTKSLSPGDPSKSSGNHDDPFALHRI
jgi:hypothetical protein